MRPQLVWVMFLDVFHQILLLFIRSRANLAVKLLELSSVVEKVNISTGFSSKLFVTKRTFEGVRDAFMDDSHVGLQFSLIRVRLVTQRAGIPILVFLSFDALVHVLLVRF